MRYFWTFFWTFLLIHMTYYVVSSMQGVAYDFKPASVLGVFAAIFIIVLGQMLPNAPAEKH